MIDRRSSPKQFNKSNPEITQIEKIKLRTEKYNQNTKIIMKAKTH